MNLSTCQLIRTQTKLLQIRQFDDFGRNWPYTKSRQNSEKRGMVNWFISVFFDAAIRVQDHWVKSGKYWPVSLFTCSQRDRKFVNLTISGGIGPIYTKKKGKTNQWKKGRWRTRFTMVLFDVETRLQKLWIYRPVSWFANKWRIRKFVNLTILGGIGPIQSQDRTAKDGELVYHGLIWRGDAPSRALCKVVN